MSSFNAIGGGHVQTDFPDKVIKPNMYVVMAAITNTIAIYVITTCICTVSTLYKPDFLFPMHMGK